MPPKSSFQNISQGQKCQIPEQKTKINAVINVNIHSFVIGEIFQSWFLRAERELKIKCPDTQRLYLKDRTVDE